MIGCLLLNSVPVRCFWLRSLVLCLEHAEIVFWSLCLLTNEYFLVLLSPIGDSKQRCLLWLSVFSPLKCFRYWLLGPAFGLNTQ